MSTTNVTHYASGLTTCENIFFMKNQSANHQDKNTVHENNNKY